MFAGCGPSVPTRAVERVALLDIDNLTGDQTLSWIEQAVPVMTASQLSGVGKIIPLRAGDSVGATNASATQVVHGYVDKRAGKLHFEFSIQDAETRAMRHFSVDGTALDAAAGLARSIDSAAVPFGSSNLAAVEAWARRDFAKAVELDPDFAAAWRELIQSQATQPDLALATATKALSRTTLKPPLERANLELTVAKLRQDDAAIAKAVQDIAKAVPNDATLLTGLAEQENAARRFSSAVSLYQAVLKASPENTNVYNEMAYSQFFAGDLPGARKSLEEYIRHPGQEANGYDSLGEILFMAGEFGEAEKNFLEAHKRNTDLLNGGDLMKAAYAHWLAGDLPGADKQFENYLKFRAQEGGQQTAWRRAVWLYATGRQEAAIASLKANGGPASGVAQGQLTVWSNAARINQDLATLERTYRSTPATADGLIRTFYARALLLAGRKDEAIKLASRWPLPEVGDPLLQSLQFPLYLELRKQLGI